MKKSEVYKAAMVAVLESDSISTEDKIDIARVLIDALDWELHKEKKAEEEAEAKRLDNLGGAENGGV